MKASKRSILKAYTEELQLGKTAYRARAWDKCFYHLERAHILGQRFIVPHTLTHLWMLKVAFHKKDLKEIIGQLFRIITGVVGSAVGVLPYGNTGGSNVNPFKPMELPEEFKELFK